jgi:O-antigen ligase
MLIPLYGFYIKDDRLFNIFLLIYATEVSFANIYHYFFIYDFADRFEGTFGGSNEFAYMLVSLIYFVYYSFYRLQNIKMKWLFTIALILLHIVVLITLSRTAILGMFIFYFFAFPYFHRHTPKWKKIMIVVAFLSLFIFALDSLGKTAELMVERFTGERGASSLGSRTFEMLAGVNLLAEHPLTVVFGNGMSISGSEIFPAFYRGMGGLGTRIHNSYFAMITENGLFTIFSFAYFIYFILKQIYFLQDDFKYVILGFTVFTISFLSTIYLLYFLPFWMALFMISAHINILDRKNKKKREYVKNQ